jgi:hypothetical protein
VLPDPLHSQKGLGTQQLWAILATLRSARQLGYLDGETLPPYCQSALDVSLQLLLRIALTHEVGSLHIAHMLGASDLLCPG